MAIRAALLGAMLAVIVICVAGRFDVDRFTFGDGVLHRYVAENIGAPRAQVTHDLIGHGTSLRYGRILLPSLIWLFSAGAAPAMPYVQPLLMVAAAAAIASAAARLMPGRTALWVLAPFLAVGLTAGLAGGFAEPVAVALALWAAVASRRERWWLAAAALAAAMLARENAAGVVIGLMVWHATRRRLGAALILASAFVPVGVWYAIVARRFGSLPLMDPFLRGTSQAFGPPLVAAWRALTQTEGRVAVVVAVHLVLVAGALIRWRRSDLWAIAAACGLQLLWNGPPQWRYIGDGVRLQVFLDAFIALALAADISAFRRRAPNLNVRDRSRMCD